VPNFQIGAEKAMERFAHVAMTMQLDFGHNHYLATLFDERSGRFRNN